LDKIKEKNIYYRVALVRNTIKNNIFILRNKVQLYKYIRNYRWITIISSKIKHIQNNFYKNKILRKKNQDDT
jgi:hypothetical protein